MMLAFGMYGDSGYAQNREYKVENDGFEWYKISTRERGTTLYGALDKQGNSIVPAKYKYIDCSGEIFRVTKNYDGYNKNGALDRKGNLLVPLEYFVAELRRVDGLSRENSLIWVETKNLEEYYQGYYNMYGKCIIPVSRKYRRVFPRKDRFYCSNVEFDDVGKQVICDASGKIVFETQNDCKSIWLINDASKGKYAIIKDNKYFVDINDNIILDPYCYSIGWEDDNISSIKIYKTKGGQGRKLTQMEMNKVLFKGDLLSGNKEYFANNKRLATLAETGGYQASSTTGNATAPSNNTNSNNNSSSNNSGGGTTTVVVEHNHDPIPVQQWQACFACGGMGTMGCTNCGGSGTKYIGDRLYTCSRCHGRGIIPCNACNGNKGQYVTVYQ